jgi:hypothetical protein
VVFEYGVCQYMRYTHLCLSFQLLHLIRRYLCVTPLP